MKILRNEVYQKLIDKNEDLKDEIRELENEIDENEIDKPIHTEPKKKKCEHKWIYKETIKRECFFGGDREDDKFYTICVCEKCGKIVKKLW